MLELAGQIEGAPRHLGIHSGGMVIADRPVSEIVPVEKARMPGLAGVHVGAPLHLPDEAPS